MRSLLTASVLCFTLTAFAKIPLPAERIVILATNDIHGGLEPSPERKDGVMGGMPFFSGVVKAIRNAVPSTYERRDVFLLDAGDQFQGTLLSNFDEGELLIQTMVKIGYDAVIPGNHDYDFGPSHWLKDKIEPSEDPAKSKEVIRKLTRLAQPRFPFLSANTYLTKSLVDEKGDSVDVKNNSCVPKGNRSIDWHRAARPDFLAPFTILKSETLSARVAIIGLDNPNTASQTLYDNVSDLCFRSPYETYLEIRETLKGKADVFIIVIHDGDTDTMKSASELARQLSQGAPLVDAIIAGHTHYVNNERVGKIPVIQSGSGGRRFGRIDIIWDPIRKVVLHDETTQFGGIKLYHDKCDTKATFCAVKDGKLTYDGEPVTPDTEISAMIARAREALQGKDQQIVATASELITRDRTKESALSNIVADGLLAIARAKEPETQVAIINASGLRTEIQPGPVTYEAFYSVLPFNNRGVIIGPMKTKDLIELVKYSIKTCGRFGTLIPAGLRADFVRSCPETNGDLDEKATLIKLEVVEGNGAVRTIYDPQQSIAPKESDTTLVATLDFLSAGGEGFTWLKQPVVSDLGVVRESLVNLWQTTQPVWSNTTDGRWKASPRHE